VTRKKRRGGIKKTKEKLVKKKMKKGNQSKNSKGEWGDEENQAAKEKSRNEKNCRGKQGRDLPVKGRGGRSKKNKWVKGKRGNPTHNGRVKKRETIKPMGT